MHADSHAPWAVLLKDRRETSAAGFYAHGTMVEALVYGARNGYNTITERMRHTVDHKTEDWRDQFLNDTAGNIFDLEGHLVLQGIGVPTPQHLRAGECDGDTEPRDL